MEEVPRTRDKVTGDTATGTAEPGADTMGDPTTPLIGDDC